MLLEILKDSLRYNFKNVGSISTMGILFLFSFLVLPIILIFGYSYRITEIGLNGLINTEMLISTDKDLKFNDFKKMFKDGIKTIILVISYLLIPIILSIIFINNHGFFISNIGSDIMIDLSHEMFLIILVTAFIGFLFINIAIPHMISNKSLSAGFKIIELMKIMKSVGIIEYILYSFSPIILLISMSIISFLLVQFLSSILSLILALFQITTNWSFMGIYYDLIVYGLLMILIIFPIYQIFQARAIALMYETGDISEF